MTPWYKVVTLREEVREGRSFSPDEFAIALEQVVAGTAPADYTDPAKFFSRTCFTRALKEHSGMVLRRLSGRTENTAPVTTLITQFGGGKTHTLTSLYHLAKSSKDANSLPGVQELFNDAGIADAPAARVGVFVGNAWDPTDGRETPWIDLARQIAGDEGVAALGSAARTTPPGTDSLARVFAAADGPVLLLFDEVLNFVNRHRGMADSFHAFLQNLTVAVTGATHAAAVISMPRSQVEMTDWDHEWQERITKVVRRVARDLIANDESEISEVVRRRIFEDLGSERTRRNVARAYADWCFERSERLPPEWMSVDTATSDIRAKEALSRRFEACYPFHPATLSVFQRKWRALTQFQQTRGALAMLAQWISWTSREQFRGARDEPLITLGSAPLHVPEFRAVVLGQLGEARLDVAIETDIAGENAHAKPLDADTRGAIRDIHRRVGAAILFESSGGQVDKVAHLPELRFALCEPNVETTTVDNAASALERSGFFMRKVGTDGYRIHHQATLRKAVSDRRASLDDDDVRNEIRNIVREEFQRDSKVPTVYFPEDGRSVQDATHLTMVVTSPSEEWREGGATAERIAQWTKKRGDADRLYPGALVWCIKKPGHELRESVELWMAWRRVENEVSQGILGPEFDRAELVEVRSSVREAKEAAQDQVWAAYRYVALLEVQAQNGLNVIDLGAGHSSGSASLSGRVITAMKSGALLNDSVGAGYIERHWPPALIESGAWPLPSLRQSFLNGVLTRLLNPDDVLRRKVVEFVESGEFGLASGPNENGQYSRLWYKETVHPDEVAFDHGVYLLTKAKSEGLKTESEQDSAESNQEDANKAGEETELGGDQNETQGPTQSGFDIPPLHKAKLRISGAVPSETWNRMGTSLIAKLRSKEDLHLNIDITVSVDSSESLYFVNELRQTLDDLGLNEHVNVAIGN